ncbi:MAG: DUF4432 family protein [Chloroflexi bacterium]|nr:DUF4432 family protein [Chloroflexota bacterium]
MHYEGERTYGCRISSAWTYRGLRTVVLENELLRVIVLADKGADIYSIVHKPSDTDFMWRTPWGVRDPQKFIPTTGGAENNWLDVYEGGWQTVVPHGGYPSTVAGAELGLHAEMSTMPWDVRIDEDAPERVSVTFSARGYRTPFSVTKTLSLETGSAVLTLDETVTNEGQVEADAVWLEHLAIGAPFLSDKCRLDVPACTVLTDQESTDESSKLVTDHRGPWPNVPGKDGSVIDFTRMPPMEDRSLDMAYMTEMPEGWYAVTNEETGVGFGLRFPADVFPYLWYWRNLGGGWGYPWYGRCYNVGLEPCTSMSNGGLAGAIENQTARHFGAGESLSVTIKAVAYTGAGPVTGIDAHGAVSRG